MESISSKKRLGYIDALRGITMLLVVFSHVEVFSFNVRESLVNELFITFRMPLFFFISGFIAYKMTLWDRTYFVHQFIKKFKVQILPTLFFSLLIFVVCRSESLQTIIEKGPREYWFTVTLFYMFIIYYSVMYVFQRFSVTIKFVVLYLFGIIGIGLYMGVGMDMWSLGGFPFYCITELSCFFHFFVFGLLCRMNYSKFKELISLDNTRMSLILLFIGLFILSSRDVLVDLFIIEKFNESFVLRYLGLLFVFSLFYRYRFSFESDAFWARGLRFIGRRTLDIYLLHYFLLPDLDSIQESCLFIFDPHNAVLELVVVLSISLVIVAFCLGISAAIRSSSILGHYLFGAKL